MMHLLKKIAHVKIPSQLTGARTWEIFLAKEIEGTLLPKIWQNKIF